MRYSYRVKGYLLRELLPEYPPRDELLEPLELPELRELLELLDPDE